MKRATRNSARLVASCGSLLALALAGTAMAGPGDNAVGGGISSNQVVNPSSGGNLIDVIWRADQDEMADFPNPPPIDQIADALPRGRHL